MIGQADNRGQLAPIPGGYWEYALDAISPGPVGVPQEAIPGEGDVVALVHFERGPFRFTVHGTPPTQSYGYPAADHESDELNRFEMKAWQVRLDQTATQGTVRIGLFLRMR